ARLDAHRSHKPRPAPESPPPPPPHPRSVPPPPPPPCRLFGHIGHHELYALELDDAAPRLAALVDVSNGVLESGARNSEGMGRDAGTRAIEGGKEYLQPIPGLSNEIGARHAAVVEDERGRARCAQA